MQLSARANQGWKVYTSLGINNQMIAFLDPYEQIALQQSCQFCYESAVGRVQTRVVVKRNFFFSKYSRIYKSSASGSRWEVDKGWQSFDFIVASI